MQIDSGQLLFSASDLVAYLACEHQTVLDLANLGPQGAGLVRTQQDESAALIARKGIEHEKAYLERLRGEGMDVIDIAAAGGGNQDKVVRTLDAMQAGRQVIYQATLRHGDLIGHADFLLRVETPSSVFGSWSYEVADTKLARSAHAKFLVQLAFYSHLLAQAQGREPAHMNVVLGDKTQRSFACQDYLHYFRAALERFREWIERLTADASPATYPVPCSHCDLCHWRDHCEAKREQDDHLCRIANIRRDQWMWLQQAGITTLAQLAALPAGAVVPRMQPTTLEKLASQAALQDEQRRTGERRHLLLPDDPEGRRGFFRLPPPDEGDLYFDMEGDPLQDGGLEYLFGVGYREGGRWQFRAFWAHDPAGERRAFEQFMDFVAQRRRQHPGAHVYHYASYEETALKRLACQHGTREAALDDMLRHGVLVDLYKVVREALRISEPSYSIKYVEHFYRPARQGEVQNAGASIVTYERWRESRDPALLQSIEDYNRDDVESTWQLHNWLLGLRPGHLAWRTDPAARNDPGDKEVPTSVQEIEQRLELWRQRLVAGLATDRLE